jgi:tetratricopeptide (TPR) repeat protein
MEKANPKNHTAQADKRSEADEACFLPPLTRVTGTSVTAAQLQIPESARREFQTACASIRKKKIADAEKRLQRALTDSPRYAVAWVLMGQIRQVQQRTDEARRACLQGSVADHGYVPAYLCLSDIAAHQRAWGEVLRFSTRAVELDPSNNAVADEYQAAALLNLRELSAAEKSAMRAVAMDLDHHEPRAHFVLAQVYEAQADTAREGRNCAST